MRPAFFSCCLLAAVATSTRAALPERVKAEDIRPERELLITDPAVLDSQYAKYPGPWSFGGLMEELFGKERAPEAVHQWLLCYYLDSTVGQAPEETIPMLLTGVSAQAPAAKETHQAKIQTDDPNPHKIAARPDIVREFILPWQQRDGFDPRSGGQWRPNLANAPFRLLAIVNRMDLGAPQLVNTQEKLQDRWKHLGKEDALAAMIGLSTKGVRGMKASDLAAAPVSGVEMPSGYGGGGRSRLATIAKERKAPPTPSDFGEGRLIFGAVGADGRPLERGWTLIFEYKLDGLTKVLPLRQGQQGSLSAQEWARAWHWLGGIDPKDPLFANSLAEITRAFTHRLRNDKCEIDSTAKTSFSQLRSSESAFGPGREFRQFALQGGSFVPALLPLTPGPVFMEDRPDGGRVLGNFLRDVEPLIRAGIHSIPEKVDSRRATVPFLGASAIIPAGDKDFHWDPAPHVSRDVRRLFSMATCNGCHAGDTGCPDGLHVHPRAENMEAALSGFLRRDGQPDRFQDPGLKSQYVQLTEMRDRATILAAMLEPRESHRLDALEDLLRDRLRRSH